MKKNYYIKEEIKKLIKEKNLDKLLAVMLCEISNVNNEKSLETVTKLIDESIERTEKKYSLISSINKEK